MVYFFDDFDSEAEGTSPPVNWIPSVFYPPTTFEVDDAQYHSSPHSAILLKSGGYGGCLHVEPVAFTSEKITIWFKFEATNQDNYLVLDELFESPPRSVQLQFDINGNIRYYNGSTYIDTGYNYTTSWFKIEIVQDFTAKTFDLWFNDALIVSGGVFVDNITVNTKYILFINSYTKVWLDDVQIGESAGGHGSLLSTHRNKLVGVV